jgi:hypothetical protein
LRGADFIADDRRIALYRAVLGRTPFPDER